jgi:hypothetical protein
VTLRPEIVAAVEALDAAIFGGDAFFDPDHCDFLLVTMASWERELGLLKRVAAGEDMNSVYSEDSTFGLLPTGTRCSDCGEQQFAAPGGSVCKNGHGGAPPKED